MAAHPAAIKPVADAKIAVADVQSLLERHLALNPHPRVLDAGCGARRYVAFGEHAHVVGLDLSAEDLARNDGLDERIVGDVQAYPMPQQSFDVVLCWDVLEHLRRPRQALT